MYPTLTLVREMLDIGPIKLSTVNQLKMIMKVRRLAKEHQPKMMTKIRDEITGEVRKEGMIKRISN